MLSSKKRNDFYLRNFNSESSKKLFYSMNELMKCKMDTLFSL